MRYRAVAPLIAALAACALAGCNGDRLATDVPSVPQSQSPDGIPEAVPFESIALSHDTSHESEPAGEGEQPGDVRRLTPLEIDFGWCPAATFEMGSRDDAPGHLLNETLVQVTFTRGFWMQQTEVTQAQYERLMGNNPSFFKDPQNPVDSVTWLEAVEFCRRLSSLPSEQRAGNVYRLPTEAEWEYACRAGTTTEFSFGDDPAEFDACGWYQANSERTTHPVAQKLANAWGLFDMHGNVAEWCHDLYDVYPQTPVTDPSGPKEGEKRTLRGGGWFFVPMFARSAHRDAYVATARYVGLGFRVVATSHVPAKSDSSVPPSE